MGRRLPLVWSLMGLLSLSLAASCRDFQVEPSTTGGQAGQLAATVGGGETRHDGSEPAAESGGAHSPTQSAGHGSLLPGGAWGRGGAAAGGALIDPVSAGSPGSSASGGASGDRGSEGSGPPSGGTETEPPRTPNVLHALGALADTPEEIAVRRIAPPSIKTSLPASVDFSDSLPPPGNQGSQSSSVAWALAYTIKSYQEGVKARWALTNERYQYSPSWIYNQLNGGVDEGIRPSAALSLLVERGVDTLRFFPYRAGSCTKKPDAASLSRAARFVGSNWGTLDADLTVLKQTLAAGQPVLITFEVFPDFDQLSPDNATYDAVGPSRGRHAVALTGYDDGRAAFRFVNSWGADWGLSGYGWLDYALAVSGELDLTAYLLNDAKNAAPNQADSLYVVENGQLWRADNEFGDYVSLSNADWTGAAAATMLGDGLYIAQGARLHRVNTADGSFTVLGSQVWSGTTAMAALGSTLYAIQGADLWQLSSLSTGARTRVGTSDFSGASAMATLGGALYIIHAGTLNKVNPATGEAITIGGARWYGAARMVALGSHLFITNDNGLWQVDDTETGAYHRLGNDDWSGAGSMTELGEQLYLIQAERLWQVDPTTGGRQPVGAASTWVGPTLLTALR